MTPVLSSWSHGSEITALSPLIVVTILIIFVTKYVYLVKKIILGVF